MVISPRRVVDQLKAAWRNGDEDTCRRLIAEDVEWVLPPSAPCVEDPADPVVRGRERFLSLTAKATSILFRPETIEVNERFSFEHETIFVEEWTMNATAHNGHAYRNSYCNIWTINGRGEVQRISEYMDTAIWQATFVPGLLLKV